MQDVTWKEIARSTSADETRALGRALGELLQPDDIVLLFGDLGAGKTQFVQGVAASLGVTDTPISPTFNIVLSYRDGRIPLHHFDLYRIDSEEELEDIGFKEYLESGGACFVEWADKFPYAFDEYLAINIMKTGDETRTLSVAFCGERPEQLLDQLNSALADSENESGHTLDAIDSAASFAPSEDASSSTWQSSKQSNGSHSRKVQPPADHRALPFVLSFDTANDVIAIGLGALDKETQSVSHVATREIEAHRSSNTRLLVESDALLAHAGIARENLACICVGRGPGSFTGVRIAMATAKGIASALGVALVGVSTLDAIAFNAWRHDVRGELLVVADAMRNEVYPARFTLSDDSVERLEADRVVKADEFGASLPAHTQTHIAGDGLFKYRELIEFHGHVLPEELWNVTGAGLLLALEALWRDGEADPFDSERHNPAFALPVYTRLSDAEEHERIRLAANDPKNLVTGVQDVAPDGEKGRATMHAISASAQRIENGTVTYRPLDAAHAEEVSALEATSMGSDAWNAHLVADELAWKNRSWWVAECTDVLVGYAGGMVVDGDLQILKVAVDNAWRRKGIARELIVRVADDARNLGATTCSLEVRKSNEGAQAFYRALGLREAGVRPRYYSDREDAVIMSGPLPVATKDVAGMELQHIDIGTGDGMHGAETADAARHPLILAIESSCDETAAALVNGDGELLSDVVASQIDFHARFGGVVPEIASRKHIEAICGVCEETLACPNAYTHDKTSWSDLDAIAVTYAPGLVGALVVGVAFGKGAAWALDVPFIGVNHLEGHLYANKLASRDFAPPAVVSLVSGGNTMLVHMRDWGDYHILGETIDDAVGEAFDKVAKALGLGYPGGPAISRAAEQGNPDAIAFPRAMMHSHDLRFSLSGLKTAVVNYIDSERRAGRSLNISDIAASFQQAVIDVQVAKAATALKQTGAPTFCLGGGVAANPALRAAYEQMCSKRSVRLLMPPLSSCGDNAGMIALVALDRYAQGKFFDLDADAHAHADLEQPY